MSALNMQVETPMILQGDNSYSLTLTDPDAIKVIALLHETKGDIRGRAFVIILDFLIDQLGSKWEAKQASILEHFRNSFAKRFQEPNWCVPISANAWLAFTISATSRIGALKCAEIWEEVRHFFIGDVTSANLPLFEVIVEDIDRLKLKPIDLKTFFDRNEDFGSKSEVRLQGSAQPKDVVGQNNHVTNTMTPINHQSDAQYLFRIGGRDLKVACAIEPIFELKKLSIIGHRLEPSIIDVSCNVLLDNKAIKNMDWGDREKVDIANLEEGLRQLELKTPAQRKFVMIVPVAFSTMASTRGRAKIITQASRRAALIGMKVIYELRGLSGVPMHRIVEVIALIKPYCMTVVGYVGSDYKTIQVLEKCGFSAVCVAYDGISRQEDEFQAYLDYLISLTKKSVGGCMIQGFDNLRQMAFARLAGVSHASVKSAAILTTGGGV